MELVEKCRDFPQKPLSVRQNKAALALVSGTPIGKVASDIGVNIKTIERWRELPLFRQKVREIEAEAFGESLSLIKRVHRAMVLEMIKLATSAKAEYVRQAATHDLIQWGIDLEVIAEQDQRLEEVTAILSEEGHNGPPRRGYYNG